MSRLQGKKILLGITGSIAAYKAATLIRLLIKEGAEVRVITTAAANHFIPNLTLSVLSKSPTYTDLFEGDTWHNHVELGLWADLMLIAPCTANTLAKLCMGQSDNMLVATYLSAKCPVAIAPAMDLDMWCHPSTVQNIKTLSSYGNHIIPVGKGELASGLVGEGRMAEPEDIITFIGSKILTQQDLSGKRVLITAGPTYEHIDPVRFIGNHSSGKMGIAIADEMASRGASVLLILGPSKHKPNHSSVVTMHVISGEEMLKLSQENYPNIDIAIFTAAVADYRPAVIADQKIKKAGNTMEIQLVKNPDIAAILGGMKSKKQINVGFALETQNEEANAIDKVKRKNFDIVVLNSLNDEGAGFGLDTNKVTLIYADGKIQSYTTKPKSQVAHDIATAIADLIYNR